MKQSDKNSISTIVALATMMGSNSSLFFKDFGKSDARPKINYAELEVEYNKIQNKTSNLSRAKRDEVVRVYLKHKNELEKLL